MGKAMLPMLGMAGLAAATGGLGGLGLGALGGAGAGAGVAGSGLAGAGSMATGALAAHGAGSAGLAAAASPGFFGAGGSLANSLNTAGKIQSMMGGMGQEQPQQSASPMGGGSMSRGGVGPADFARAANLTQPQQGISALQSFLNGGMQA